MLIYIIIATLIVSLLSFLGILFIPTKKERLTEIGISLAVGALLGAVFLNIIPEIFESDTTHIDFHSIIILLSIISFFLIERLFHWHHCHCDPNHCADCQTSHQHMGWINITGDGLHNFVDGMIIGASFMVDIHLGIITTVAIILHEIPQEIGDFSILLKSGFTRARALFWNFISALLAVAGGLVAYFFGQSANYTNILLSIAAGSFLYLAMSDIIPQLHHSERKHHTWQIMAIILGIVLIYLGGWLLPHG
ncbi:MAG: ZIP family metal transporter [bacterium]